MTTSQHFKQKRTQNTFMESTGIMENLTTQIFRTQFINIVLLQPNSLRKDWKNASPIQLLVQGCGKSGQFGLPKSSKLISN